MVLDILKFVFILLEVLLLFNLLIIVHELGHFLAAKWRGLVVEKFGIWFGKPVWKKKIRGIEFSLGSIPAGGFVALPQMAPMEALEGKGETDRKQLPPISTLDKIIVAFAGPLFSFGLAIVFALIVWLVGRPVGQAEASTIVGYTEPGSPAAQAGIQPGDKLLEVDGHVVRRFSGMGDDSITWRVVRSEGEVIPIKLQRGEEIIEVDVRPLMPKSTSWWRRKSLRQILIQPAADPMVGQVAPGSAAEQAGFKANDVVVALNGKPVLHERAIFDWLVAHPGEPAILTVERDGERIDLTYVRPLPEVGSLVKGFPAENAGIRPGDVITSVDGVPASDAMWLTKYIREHKGGPLSFEVKRGEETFTIKVTPAVPEGESTPIIGVGWKGDGIAWDQMGRFTIDHPGPFEQVRDSVATILNTFDALFSPKTGVGAQHLSGPVMIFRIYYLMFESDQGWRLALWFSVILNINLAILNLLPFPVLDGGHITIALVEAIRRRPINVRVLEFVQTACAMLLIGYMLYVTFFDVGDIFGGNWMRFEKPATEQTEP